MTKKIYNHCCNRCSHVYLSYDADMVYCSSVCRGKDKYEEMYPSAKKRKTPNSFAEIKPVIKKKEDISEQERWLNKKPPVEIARKDMRTIMYSDTFKKWVPKHLKVMRG